MVSTHPDLWKGSRQEIPGWRMEMEWPVCRVLTGLHPTLNCTSLTTVWRRGSYRSFVARWLVYNCSSLETVWEGVWIQDSLRKWLLVLLFGPPQVQTAGHIHPGSTPANPHLINKGVQGFVLCTVFQTLSNPGVDGPVSQVPAVGTVSKSK